MPQLIDTAEGKRFTATHIEEIQGLDLSKNAQVIDKQRMTKMENVTFRDEGVQTDIGIIAYLGLIDGTPRFVHKHEQISGTITVVLITNTSLYRLTSGQWRPIDDGVTTTTDTPEAAGQTVIGVASTTNFIVGRILGLQLDSGIWHMSAIVSIDSGVSITIATVLPTAMASGRTVVQAYKLSGNDDNPVVAVTVPFADDVIFTNGLDAVQRYDVSAQSCAAVANMPSSGDTECVSVAMFDNSLFLFSTNEGGTKYKQRVRWSAAGNIEDWTTANDAGYIDLYDYSHEILFGAKLGPYLVIYRSDSITRCIVENSTVKRFAFPTVVTGEGIFSVTGVADIGDEHFIVGKRNCYIYKGGFELEPIGTPIAEEFLEDGGRLESAYKSRLFTMYDGSAHRVLIFYSDASGVFPNRCWIYDIFENKWTERKFNKTITGHGATTLTVVLTWNDLNGTWLQQEFNWGGSVGTPDKPVLLLCSGDENRVFSYDPNTANDAGTTIVTRMDTGDFYIPHMSSRFDYLQITAIGGSTTIWFSLDKGRNWTKLKTVAFTLAEQTIKIYCDTGQFLFRSLRLRFESNVFLRLIDYAIISKIEEEVA